MKTPMAVTAAKAKYEASDAALDDLIKRNRDVFEEYEQLCIHRNETLANFKAAVSDNADKLGSKFGPWKLSIPRTLNAEVLVKEMGEDVAEPFLKVKITVDSKAYDKGVADLSIPEAVQAKVEGDGNARLIGPKAVGIYSR